MSLAMSDADGFAPLGQGRFARLHTYWLRHSSRFTLAGHLAAAAAAALAAAVMPGHAPYVARVAPVRVLQVPAGPPAAVVETVDGKQALESLLTKAGFRPRFDLRRLSLDQARKLNALNPVLAQVRAGEAPPPFALSIDTKNGKQALHCLTEAAYFEAGANGPDAEAAVVQVVLNRVRHPDFPKTVCGVVYQGAEHAAASGGGCQFTFTCDGALTRPQDAAAWDEARKVAARALGGYVVKTVGVATYYHADYVFPAWAPGLVKTATVGPHIFYRMAGQEGRATYLTGQYRGDELKLRAIMQRALETRPPAKDEPKLELASSAEGVRVQAGPAGRVHAQYAADAKPASAEVVKAASDDTAAPQPVAETTMQPAA
jgi:spore germination cell wall hydrolase CwlJ-like protein